MKNSIVILLTLLTFSIVLSVRAQGLQEGLVAHWKFNEGSGAIANDSSGNGNNGDLNGDPQWVDGYFGGALEFDGSGDEVNVPYDAMLNPEEFTACVWANAAAEGTGHRAAISCRDDFPQRGYIIYAEPGNTWQFWIGVGAGGIVWNVAQGPDVKLDEWSHLAAVYSDGQQKFYVDGELSGEAEATLNLNTSKELLIGAGANELDPHQFLFVGMLDDVRVYNRALSENEIAQVMQQEEASAVTQVGKLPITWGNIKRSR